MVKKFLRNILNESELVERLFGDYIFRWRFREELSLLNGSSLSDSNHPSIIHMGVNRGATQWVKDVLRRVGHTVDLVHVNWNGMAFHSDYPYLDQLGEVGQYKSFFRPRGYLYSSFGGYPVGIPELEKYKVVLVVRDPRDVLVSRYFSIKVSHGVPPVKNPNRDEFLKRREQAQEESIDEFVFRTSQRLRDTYDEYMYGLLEDHPDVHIARYEDMATDVEEWLSNVLSYIEISPPKSLVREIVEEARAVQEKDEDETEHVRKGKPGDHREKLSPRTIERLNDTFSDVLQKFEYAR